MEEIEALVALTSIPLLGSIKIRLLVHHFGSALNAIKAKPNEWADLPGFGPKILMFREESLKKGDWRRNLELVYQHDVAIIPYNSACYPSRLLEIVDHPILLYCKGEMRPSDSRCLAIVGTRDATHYGLSMGRQLARSLASLGFTIVSGLARGIDTAVHEGALESGRTFAVLGSGLACLYPRENARLAEIIYGKGALLSEFSMFTPPDRTHFPQRNRIVSGMAMGVVLIEAPFESGAMLTVGNARDQGRPVFVLPGRADQESFKGNHALIKQGRGLLVENAEDIASHFESLFLPIMQKGKEPSEFQVPLEKEEASLLKHLLCEELSIEDIILRSGLSASKTSVLLMSLVLKKVIREYPGKIYKKH